MRSIKSQRSGSKERRQGNCSAEEEEGPGGRSGRWWEVPHQQGAGRRHTENRVTELQGKGSTKSPRRAFWWGCRDRGGSQAAERSPLSAGGAQKDELSPLKTESCVDVCGHRRGRICQERI